MKSLRTKDLYMTIAQFDLALEVDVLIITYPSKGKPYYVCERGGSVVHIYILKMSNSKK